MVMIAIAVMLVAAVAIVALPYFEPVRKLSGLLGKPADPAVEHLIAQREATYAAIKDLEFDRAMEKLSDADYKTMRSKYEAKAVSILQELDGLAARKASRIRSRVSTSDDPIEQKVKELRQGATFAASVNRGAGVCPQCGAPRSSGDAFCPKCGASFRGARCANCGTTIATGDKFCARCGAPVGSPASKAG